MLKRRLNSNGMEAAGNNRPAEEEGDLIVGFVDVADRVGDETSYRGEAENPAVEGDGSGLALDIRDTKPVIEVIKFVMLDEGLPSFVERSLARRTEGGEEVDRRNGDRIEAVIGRALVDESGQVGGLAGSAARPWVSAWDVASSLDSRR